MLGSETMGESEKGERWSGAMTNLTEMASNLDSLQKLLLTKAVFVDDDTFSKASLAADQARSIKLLHQRVQTLEREVDAAITAAARARSEKRQAEAAQKSAESRAQQLTLTFCCNESHTPGFLLKNSKFWWILFLIFF